MDFPRLWETDLETMQGEVQSVWLCSCPGAVAAVGPLVFAEPHCAMGRTLKVVGKQGLRDRVMSISLMTWLKPKIGRGGGGSLDEGDASRL